MRAVSETDVCFWLKYANFVCTLLAHQVGRLASTDRDMPVASVVPFCEVRLLIWISLGNCRCTTGQLQSLDYTFMLDSLRTFSTRQVAES